VRSAATETEFSLSDRESYLEFVAAVQSQSTYCLGSLIDEEKLKNLWHGARYFKQHWKTPTKRADRSMIWSAFMFGLDKNAAKVIYLEWTLRHGRNMSQEEFDRWKVQVLDKTWIEAQPRITAYTEKIMKEKAEKKAGKLRTRIEEALKEGRATTDMLAKKLDVSPKAIDGHLYRMAGSADGSKAGTGEVKRVAWGLYEWCGKAEQKH
jgi:hypothetical protein